MATLSRTPMSSKKAKMTQASSEWTLASDDAWDSASDSESAYKPPISTSSSRIGGIPGAINHRSASPGARGIGTSSSKPIPVAGPTTAKSPAKSFTKSSSGLESATTGSQSSISFSYTHVDAPSPSSSYARQGTIGKAPGTGWTMVTSPLSSSTYGAAAANLDGADVEVENEVQVDADGSVTELGGGGIGLSRNRRIKEGKEAIKYDVEEIVNGQCLDLHCGTDFSVLQTLYTPYTLYHRQNMRKEWHQALVTLNYNTSTPCERRRGKSLSTA